VPLGSGRLEFALWGKNLADKDWVADSIGSFRGFVADRIAAYGEPRSYGLTVTYDL
jgi:outer membrane receptor protein involved in Fe transport